MGRRSPPLVALLLLAGSGCTVDAPARQAEPPASANTSTTAKPAHPLRPSDTDDNGSRALPPDPPAASHRGTRSDSAPPAGQAKFDSAAAMTDVRWLAGRIGPRLATGPAFHRAARGVHRRLAGLGYDVQRQRFSVPGGDSWGVTVGPGRSSNVVASPRDFAPRRPHVLVGAHLDTVARAPGAEDNASGVAVVLELARLASIRRTRLPVVFVAYGAEEPRGPGDDLHHFGSQHQVREMPRSQRAGLRAMVSVDRVGVGQVVPVCTGPLSPARVQRRLLRTAERIGVPGRACDNTASDHWSFEKAGFPVARLGSTSYAAYHSAADVPSVVNPRQLDRTGRLLWAWLDARRGPPSPSP